MPTIVPVAAALIRSGDRILICRRPPDKARGLLWEFVGGKLEPGETAAQALVRECEEELGITVEPGQIFLEVTHTYPDVTIQLTLLETRIAAGVPQMREHIGLCWVLPSELPQYEFCPADQEILEKLMQP